jgi:PDZ domain-containing protein
MRRQMNTLVVAVLSFTILLALAALLPASFVIWSPGNTYDFLDESGTSGRKELSVTGIRVYPTDGKLLLATVTEGQQTPNLASVLDAFASAESEVLPANAVAAADEPTLVNAASVQSGVIRRNNAIVAALVQARLIDPDITLQVLPMVDSVSNSGPASGVLEAGDLIAKVGEAETDSVEAVQKAVSLAGIGDEIQIEFLRDRATRYGSVKVVDTANQPGVPTIGVSFGVGYLYDAKVELDEELQGASEGLMLAVALYDMLTPTDLTNGLTFAGAGSVDAAGKIQRVDGISARIAAARRDGAVAFVLPRDNCSDRKANPGITLIPADSLGEALKGIVAVAKGQSVKGCD